MKILALHPADSPRRGPWSGQHWDLIIDLGTSSEAVAEEWQMLAKCPVVRLASYREAVEDPRRAGDILRSGFGQLRDSFDLDWWELTSLYVHAEVETWIALRRMIEANHFDADLYCTRDDWPVSAFAALCGREVRSLSPASRVKFVRRVRGYAGALTRLNFSQTLDVIGDKYDASYRWRSRIHRRRPASAPVVLVPTAYTNVSRGAAKYAALLPELNFLFVATRGSAFHFAPPKNARVSHLAAYAARKRSHREYEDLLRGWELLRRRLEEISELACLSRTGGFDRFPNWFRTGLAVRDAWNMVLDQESVTGVLCGDDSNWHTRLPVLLARKRNLPTIDFHHGAFDGRFLMKELSSDLYLAKSEMERDYLTRICHLPPHRVVVGGIETPDDDERVGGPALRPNIVFFSEPFESAGARPEEIYRELLPALSQLAREHGRTLILKLHPFESRTERCKLVDTVLGAGPKNVKVMSGPLTKELLFSAWFGITVQSSSVLDCAKAGVPCFHCQWLVNTPWGYGQQFARFGVGRLLRSKGEIARIPTLLAEGSEAQPDSSEKIRPAAEILREVFAARTVTA